MYSKPPPTASVAEVRDSRVQPGEKRLSQDCGNVDGRGLQEDVLRSAKLLSIPLPSAAAIDPEHRVVIVGFHQE